MAKKEIEKLVSKPNEVFKNKLKRELGKSGTPPFLFVGSGMSIRYYGIPTWITLLSNFVDINSKCFKFEFGFYSSSSNGDPLKIASMLATEFHEYWWKSDEFKDKRSKYSNIAGRDVEIAFKIELCEFIEQRKRLNNELIEEITLLEKSNISGVLTTNWDDFLEGVFKDFQTKIGQKEVIFSENNHIGDIYKIHGCVSKPESLVVTSQDYERFISTNHYLNSKILTLFVDFPIIFLGYSLSDPNIDLILKNIVDCLNEDIIHIEKLSERLFFVEWQNLPCVPSMETTTYKLKAISIPLIKIKAHTFVEIFEVLNELPRKFSVNILRQLQKMVYDFVITSEPTNRIMVNGLEDLDKVEDLEVVVGFGNISKLQDKGVVGLKDLDLIKDILFDDLPKENYSEIVEHLLPSIIRKNVFIPFFKYQKYTNNLNEDNSLKNHTYDNFTLCNSKNISIEDYRLKNQKKTMERQIAGIESLESLIQTTGFIHAIQRIPYLSRDKINNALLRNYLKENYDKIEAGTGYFSHFRKCVCLLDFLDNSNN